MLQPIVFDICKPIVMGILNVTPDSFSDGGQYLQRNSALQHAIQMAAEGAAIIDIGGESTRPYAETVSTQEELDRVIPIIQAVKQELDIAISIDTYKPEVMQEAVKAGAAFINDINALQAPGALEFAAKANLPICLMHKQGTPQTMQTAPNYDDVVTQVKEFLLERVQACLAAGIKQEHIMLDPGFGFGKTLEHNLQLLRGLKAFTSLGFPILAGTSRKAMLGQLLDAPVSERLYGSLALAAWSILQGVKIIRTHDVKATIDVIKTLDPVTNVN